MRDRRWSRRDLLKASTASAVGVLFAEPLKAAPPPATEVTPALIEGIAEDGTIEAIRIADAASFALGVQWHAEYDPQRNPINRALFEAFGEALKAHQRAS